MTALNKQARHVQRYTNYGVDMMEWDDGTYVKYSDYLARLDELEAAEKRIAEHNFENRLLANADRDIKALRQRIAELEALDKPKFVKCWSCKHDIEVLAIVDCDGYCPRCAAPIDLDDEPYAGIGVKVE